MIISSKLITSLFILVYNIILFIKHQQNQIRRKTHKTLSLVRDVRKIEQNLRDNVIRTTAIETLHETISLL